MSTTGDDRARFESFLATMASNADLGDLSTDRTIRRGTLVARDTDADAAPPPETAVPARDAAAAALPRISLGAPTGEALPTRDGHDLVLLRSLGEGGMGTVALAVQRSLGREVAVKRLRPELATPDGARTLLREARVAGALEHPNVVPVHMLGVDTDGTPVLVMKRVEGAAWADLVEDPAHPLWAALAPDCDDRADAHVQIAVQVCRALEYAHDKGVVHRDVKPENVLVGRYGEVYLVDWGLAIRLEECAATERERGREIVGTPAFLAPEMAEGRATLVGARTDVYLLGATLHAVLTGTVRHAGTNLHAVIFQAWLSPPFDYPATIPADLAALMNSACARDPAARPPSAAAFRRALERHRKHQSAARLAHAAAETLARADDLCARRPEAITGPEVWRLLTESRFGFAQAAREWPESPAAREGVAACVRRLVERELAQRSPAGARAVLGELDAVPPELEARVAALEREVTEERARDEALREEARERDLSVSRRERVRTGLGLVAFNVLLVAVFAATAWRGGEVPVGVVVGLDVGIAAAVGGAALAGRRRLYANRISGAVTSLMVCTVVLIAMSDAVGWYHGRAFPELAVHTLLLTAAMSLTSGFLLLRAFFVAAAVMLAAALVCLLAPQTAGVVAPTALGCGLSIILYGFYRQGGARRAPGA